MVRLSERARAEDRMENQLPRAKTLGEAPSVKVLGDASVLPPPDTKMVRATDTPGENSPLWGHFSLRRLLPPTLLAEQNRDLALAVAAARVGYRDGLGNSIPYFC